MNPNNHLCEQCVFQRYQELQSEIEQRRRCQGYLGTNLHWYIVLLQKWEDC